MKWWPVKLFGLVFLINWHGWFLTCNGGRPSCCLSVSGLIDIPPNGPLVFWMKCIHFQFDILFVVLLINFSIFWKREMNFLFVFSRASIELIPIFCPKPPFLEILSISWSYPNSIQVKQPFTRNLQTSGLIWYLQGLCVLPENQ